MNLYEKILEESRSVNNFWKAKVDGNFSHVKINFGKYGLKVEGNFAEQNFPLNSFFIADKNLNINVKNFLMLEASESKTKNIDFINQLIHDRKENFIGKTLVAVGGGIILDTALCIAQILSLKIILVPTSILAMSDSSIGSKARANKVVGDKFMKHFYRELHDPGEIVICENFLDTIPDRAVLFSSAEIIKHAFFQSDDLLDYLISNSFEPFQDKKSLMKAILWTADLKRVCMEVDPRESVEGSRKIIREGHIMADKIEKESGFTVSHGEAVLRGIKHDLEIASNKTRLDWFNTIYNKLKI